MLLRSLYALRSLRASSSRLLPRTASRQLRPGSFGLAIGLALLVLSPSLARAAIHAVTMTGTVQLFAEPPDFFLNDLPPVSGGESFTLTFDLDDAAPQTSTNGTTIASYGPAVSNVVFTIDGVGTIGASSEEVLAAINTGFNHQWSVFVFTGSPGFTTTLPEILSFFDDGLGEDEDFFLQSLDVFLLDSSQTAYAQTPPELVVPSSAAFAFRGASVRWVGGTSGAEASIELDVASVTSTPVGPAVPALGLPALGVLGAALGMVGQAALRRRRGAERG